MTFELLPIQYFIRFLQQTFKVDIGLLGRKTCKEVKWFVQGRGTWMQRWKSSLLFFCLHCYSGLHGRWGWGRVCCVWKLIFTEQILSTRNCTMYFMDMGTDNPQQNFVTGFYHYYFFFFKSEITDWEKWKLEPKILGPANA